MTAFCSIRISGPSSYSNLDGPAGAIRAARHAGKRAARNANDDPEWRGEELFGRIVCSMVQPKKALFMIHVRTMAKAPPEANPLSAEVKPIKAASVRKIPALAPGKPPWRAGRRFRVHVRLRAR